MSMTLEQVRDWHLSKVALYSEEAYPRAAQRHQKMADAIDAHLATPAQTVDAAAHHPLPIESDPESIFLRGFAFDALVAAGHVSKELAEKSLEIARKACPEPNRGPGSEYEAGHTHGWAEAADAIAGTLVGTHKLMPIALTAENGAKAALMGEFEQTSEVTCPECTGNGYDDDDKECAVCDGSGTVDQVTVIEWTTIKAIYAAAVKHFHPELS
ncbi:MAG: hypothetical protein V4641_05840 [Pseudomonadota bacterium]